jgi:sarcosine oxidase
LSPCSGHGFKYASVVGEIAADLVQRGKSRFDLSLFRYKRFVK